MADSPRSRAKIKAVREAGLKRRRRILDKVEKRALVEEQVRYLVKKTREDDDDWLADEEDDESQLAEGIDSDNSLSSNGHCVNEDLEVHQPGAPCSSASVSGNEMPYSDNVSCATSQENTALQSSDLVASSSECGDECNTSDDGIPSDVDDLEDCSLESDIPCTNALPVEIVEEIEENPDKRLERDLAQWAVTHLIKSRALSNLLGILRDHGHTTLPKTSKTLLHTPQSTIEEIREFPGGGKFWYFGILRGMQSRLSETYLSDKHNGRITIDIFTDGLSPYNSNGVQIWPIAGRLVDQTMPFLIAMWCGDTKEPQDLDAFWEDFINEAIVLKEGFELHGNIYKLDVRNYMGDAVARNWFKRTNPHNSKICCERCTAIACSCNHRMVYEPGVATLRTDQSFRCKEQPTYHRGISPLEMLGTNMISQVPLDTMHLLYLGIIKRMIVRLLRTKQTAFTLRKTEIEEVSQLSEEILPYLPSEFKTKRGLKALQFFKAKEFRRIALYDGFLLFKSLPHPRLYQNFLLLACALRILASPALVSVFVDDAEKLLHEFVRDSQHVYGNSFIVYNVHHLEHLAEECRRHGTLEEMTCFPYENYLGKIKALLFAPGRTLPQLVCRLRERLAILPNEEPPPKPATNYEQPHFAGPTLDVRGEQYRRLETPHYTFHPSRGNDCHYLTKSGDIVLIRNIIKTDDQDDIIIGQKFQHKWNYFEKPLPSAALDIFLVRGLKLLQKFHLRDVKTKIVLLPLKPSAHVDWRTDVVGLCLPMLHNVNS